MQIYWDAAWLAGQDRLDDLPFRLGEGVSHDGGSFSELESRKRHSPQATGRCRKSAAKQTLLDTTLMSEFDPTRTLLQPLPVVFVAASRCGRPRADNHALINLLSRGARAGFSTEVVDAAIRRALAHL